MSNHSNQISEAFRVLKRGGQAAFSVWGRRENCAIFTLIPEILKWFGIESPPSKSAFHLNDDKYLRNELLKAGFSNVKTYYTPANKTFFTGESVFEWFSQGTMFKGIEENLLNDIKKEFIAEFDKRFGPESTDFITFEALVAICVK